MELKDCTVFSKGLINTYAVPQAAIDFLGIQGVKMLNVPFVRWCSLPGLGPDMWSIEQRPGIIEALRNGVTHEGIRQAIFAYGQFLKPGHTVLGLNFTEEEMTILAETVARFGINSVANLVEDSKSRYGYRLEQYLY